VARAPRRGVARVVDLDHNAHTALARKLNNVCNVLDGVALLRREGGGEGGGGGARAERAESRERV
jgi:hypothetical protein